MALRPPALRDDTGGIAFGIGPDLRGLADFGGMDSRAGIALLEPIPRTDIFLAAFDVIPDPRADNSRYRPVRTSCGGLRCGALRGDQLRRDG